MTTLQQFAKEINNNWSKSYSAIVQDNELRLKFDNLVIATYSEEFGIEMLELGFVQAFTDLSELVAK